jgi:hypothetical protein
MTPEEFMGGGPVPDVPGTFERPPYRPAKLPPAEVPPVKNPS